MAFKHHKYFPKARQVQAFLFPHVCCRCQKSFKKPVSFSPRVCPQCGDELVQLSRKFKVPRARDREQWEKVQFLLEQGFRFYSVYERTEFGEVRVSYPRTLAEAKLFVRGRVREVGPTTRGASGDAV
jgi:predicted  nucleic acid-binding Zn-ribbon protein